jgi:hypothetical protein
VTRLGADGWRPQSQQQVRNKSKAAREAERNIVVKLLLDVPRFGRAGTIAELLSEVASDGFRLSHPH